MALASQSLSSLCSICHIQQPKYTCPGCLTKTCGLACIKKHKARTLCSGKRDPAKYATRIELNSEAGFDRDYNFLSSVGLEFEAAERDAVRRGIISAGSSRSDKRSGPQKGEGPMRKSLEADAITIIRAPPGMAIAKSNHTHWRAKGGGISWTVKWNLRIWSTKRDDSPDEQRRLLDAHWWPCTGTNQCHEGLTPAHGFKDWLQGRTRAETKRNLRNKEPPPTEEQRLEYKAWETEEQIDKKAGAVADFRFYLEAPDKRQPTRTALIPFDGSSQYLTFKTLLKGRTLVEMPTISVWKNGQPSDEFLVLDPFIAPSAEGLAVQENTQISTSVSTKRTIPGPERDPSTKRQKTTKCGPDMTAHMTSPNLSEANDTANPTSEQETYQRLADDEGQGDDSIRNTPDTLGEERLDGQSKVPGGLERKTQTTSGLGGLDYSSD